MDHLASGIHVGVDLDEALVTIGDGLRHKQIPQGQPQGRDYLGIRTAGMAVHKHRVPAGVMERDGCPSSWLGQQACQVSPCSVACAQRWARASARVAASGPAARSSWQGLLFEGGFEIGQDILGEQDHIDHGAGVMVEEAVGSATAGAGFRRGTRRCVRGGPPIQGCGGCGGPACGVGTICVLRRGGVFGYHSGTSLKWRRACHTAPVAPSSEHLTPSWVFLCLAAKKKLASGDFAVPQSQLIASSVL